MIPYVVCHPGGNGLTVDGNDFVLVADSIFADIITWMVMEETTLNREGHCPTKMFSSEKCTCVSAT